MGNLKDDIARWDDAAKTMIGEEVITGKGKGVVVALDVHHPGEYFCVSYDNKIWKGEYWEHVTSVRRIMLFA